MIHKIPTLKDQIIYNTITYNNTSLEIKTTINEANEITETEYKDPITNEYIETSNLKVWNELSEDENKIYQILIKYVEDNEKYEKEIKKNSQNINIEDPIIKKINIDKLNCIFQVHNIEIKQYTQHIYCEIWDVKQIKCLKFTSIVDNNSYEIYIDEDESKTSEEKQLYKSLEYALNNNGLEKAYFDKNEEYNFTYEEKTYCININEVVLM